MHDGKDAVIRDEMKAPKTLSALAVPLDIEPMEAKLVEELPEGNWQYEPKWDGFRCLAFKAGSEVDLKAKSGKPLARYFPEMVETLKRVPARSFVLDGELAIVSGGEFSFEALLQRIHPAESRIKRLAAETPAIFILFDLLLDASRQEPDRGAADDAARCARNILRLGEAGERAEAFALHAESRGSRALAQAGRHRA